MQSIIQMIIFAMSGQVVKRPSMSLGSRPQSHNQIDNSRNFTKEEMDKKREGFSNKKKNQCKMTL